MNEITCHPPYGENNSQILTEAPRHSLSRFLPNAFVIRIDSRAHNIAWNLLSSRYIFRNDALRSYSSFAMFTRDGTQGGAQGKKRGAWDAASSPRRFLIFAIFASERAPAYLSRYSTAFHVSASCGTGLASARAYFSRIKINGAFSRISAHEARRHRKHFSLLAPLPPRETSRTRRIP